MNFPDQVKEILNNARYWRNTNILSEEYVNLIINVIIGRIDSRIRGIKATNHWDDNEDTSHFCDCDEFEDYAVWMELEDMKKVFRGENN